MNFRNRSASKLAGFMIVCATLVGCQASNKPPRIEGAKLSALQASLDSILNRKRDTGAFVAARVVDVATGQELFSQDADRSVKPASNMKLTVTSAALDFFGKDAEFETDLIVAGQDLYLVGHGDPAVGDPRIAKNHGVEITAPLDAWADELIAKGLTKFAGNLYFVDNAFEAQQTHPTWAGMLDQDYAAPIGGLNFNDNCIDIRVKPTKVGSEVDAELIPDTSHSVVLINRATTSEADKKANIDWTRADTQNVYTLIGSVPVGDRVYELDDSKPVTDPGSFFADALRTRLAARGITIAGPTTRADAPPTGAVVKLKPATTKLTDILARVNKNSQNTLAEGLAKLMSLHAAMKAGVEKPQGNWATADQPIRAFWARVGVDGRAYNLADGSGLSHDNRVSAHLISDILIAMAHHKDFDTFRESMSIMGVDGSTSKRLKDLPNRAYAKTGYINGVRALSGYAKTDSGRWIVFSFIYNNIPAKQLSEAKPFEELQDAAVRELLKQ